MYPIVVLLSVYNGERFLREQVESILSQQCVDVKILVRIDGSDDGSVDIIREFQVSFPEKIILIKGDNIGFAMSFTTLLQEANVIFPDCEYFAFADQDDVWLPDKLIAGVSAIAGESDEIPVTYCSATRQVDINLIPIGHDTVLNPEMLTKPRALVQNFATGCTMVFNRRALETYISHIPEEIKVHDFLMYQICMFLGKVIYDTTPHILYRQHGHNQIGRPNAIGRMKKRLQGNFRKHVLEKQNRCFYNAFQHLLSSDDRKLFERFINYRSSLVSRFRLLSSKSISYTKREANFFFRLKVLLGSV